MVALLQLALALQLLPSAQPLFFLANFNDTSTLRLNGGAALSVCGDANATFGYASPLVGATDGPGGVTLAAFDEAPGSRALRTVAPFDGAAAANESRLLAGFGGRDSFSGAPAQGGGCAVRLRLTPPRPFKAAAAFHLEPVPVLDGWEAGFVLQLTEPARQCTRVKDATFGTASHAACTVAGGDGLAFVVHGDPAVGSAALGEGGGGLGYAGLPRAVAVEFDTWFNPGGGVGDLPWDHVAVQAAPAGGAEFCAGRARVTAGTDTRVSGAPLRVDLADGAPHAVRVAYYPALRADFVSRFVGAPPLLQHLTAGADRRPVGTLAVWVDEVDAATGEAAGAAPGAARNGSLLPTLALPLNINEALRLAGDQAWVGLTAATGSAAWQAHDVLSWYFCERAGCEGWAGAA